MFRSKWKAGGIILLVLGGGAFLVVLGAGAMAMAYEFAQGPGQSKSRVVQALTSSAAPGEVADWAAGWPELTAQPDDDPMSKKLLKAFEKPIPMNFPVDTPLSDVVDYLKTATVSPELPKGLILYVDPIGLQDADKTLASTVTMVLEDVPLKTTLRLLLGQVSLMYRVKDGLVTITSAASDDQVTPFSVMEEKAMRGELSRVQYKQLIEALKLKLQVEKLTGRDGE